MEAVKRDTPRPRPLGRTGRKVYPIGFGASLLSLEGRRDESEGIAVIHAAIDAGITLIDTADAYCQNDAEMGHNERLIGKAVRAHPAGKFVTVITKGGMTRPRGTWKLDGRPERLIRSCEASLRALGVDAIPLYQLQGPDEKVPFSDSVGALARLKQVGKIEHVGLCNVSPEQLAEAQKILRVDSVQNACNPRARADFANGLIASCLEQGVTYLAHSPVGGFGLGHRNLSSHVILGSIGIDHHVSSYQVMLAWLLTMAPHIVPVVGATKRESIRDSAAAVSLQLSDAELNQIEAV